MNTQPHFVTALADLDIHFVHANGSSSNLTPLLIAHGWPRSWHSYHGLIGPLTHREQHGGSIEDAFDVIIPSYPGYDFASRPPRSMEPHAIARLFDELIANSAANVTTSMVETGARTSQAFSVSAVRNG